MRWFKHVSTAHDNELISSLLNEFGGEGYATLFLILEYIAALMPTTKTEFLKNPDRCCATYPVDQWAKFCHVSTKKFQKILEFLKNEDFFLTEFGGKNKKLLKISCPKLLIYRDEHTKRLGSGSRVTPEALPSDSRGTPEQDNKTTDIKYNNKYINITNSQQTTLVDTHACSLEAKNKILPTDDVSATTSQLLFDLLEKYFPNFFEAAGIPSRQIHNQQKISYLVREWVAQGVWVDDVEAAIEHTLGARPDQKINSPLYFELIALKFKNSREETGSYDQACWGNSRVSVSSIDAAAERLKKKLREQER